MLAAGGSTCFLIQGYSPVRTLFAGATLLLIGFVMLYLGLRPQLVDRNHAEIDRLRHQHPTLHNPRVGKDLRATGLAIFGLGPACTLFSSDLGSFGGPFQLAGLVVFVVGRQDRRLRAEQAKVLADIRPST